MVGFVLGMVQMVLYGVYRNSGEINKPAENIEKKLNSSSEQQLKSIVVISPLGVSEVHPVDVTVTEPVVVGPLSDSGHHEDPSKEEEPSIEDGKCHVETSPPDSV